LLKANKKTCTPYTQGRIKDSSWNRKQVIASNFKVLKALFKTWSFMKHNNRNLWRSSPKKTLIIKPNHYTIKNKKMKQQIENDKMTKKRRKPQQKKRLVYCCNSK
jgi:hypothetical protein